MIGDLEKPERKFVVIDDGDGDEEEKLLMDEGMAVLDFDLLCSTVAMQTHGKWPKLKHGDGDDVDVEGGGGGELGGVLRMWEGDLLDCFDDRRVALQAFCCPCYRFGVNMRRAGFGYCFIQGTTYFLLAIGVLLNGVAYIITKRNCFLYLALALTVLVATYLGFSRTKIRKKFNIRGSDSSLDDCFFHLLCSCCTLCQESRTLEMNNVQDGTWHGRSDTICIGTSNEGSKSFVELHPPPLVSTNSPKPCFENEIV